ncbi:MAG: recombinase RecT [Coriobacteriia bacterium]|nr:recombinase RecT [Coriobacteriia bacterium]
MTDLLTATEGASIQALNPRNTYEKLIIDRWDRIAFLLPEHVKQEKVFQVLSSTVSQDPKLLECSSASLVAATLTCAALGLLPSKVDGLGHCFIIPYGKEATFQFGYKGVLELARRSGEIADITAAVVYQGDEFMHIMGDAEQIIHVPDYSASRSPENIIATYMVMRLTNGGVHREVMTIDEVMKIRDRSQAYQTAKRFNKKSAWDTDPEAMIKKTVINRAKPYMPLSPEIRTFWRDADEPKEASGSPFDFMLNDDAVYEVTAEDIEF